MRSDGAPTRGDLLQACLCVSVGVSVLYAGPVYRAAAGPELGWSTAATAGAFALGYAAVLPMQVLAGRAADRVGPGALLAAGSTTTALASFGAAATAELWQWYLTAGVGLTVGYYATFIATGLLASLTKNRGTTLGLIFGLGYGSGLTAGPLVAQTLIDQVGWRAALVVEGGVAALVALAAARHVRRRFIGEAPAAATREPSTALREARRAPLLAGFFVGNMLIAIYDESVYQHGYGHGATLGLDGTAAAGVIGAVSASLTAGLIVGGALSDAVGRRPVLVAAALASAGAVLGFMGSSGPRLWLWGAAFGFALGASLAVRTAAWADAFAGPRLGRDVGIVSAGYPAGAAITTYGGAAWLDAGGSFQALYLTAAGAAVLWAILGAALTRPRPRAAREGRADGSPPSPATRGLIDRSTPARV
jgi:MFS family permease